MAEVFHGSSGEILRSNGSITGDNFVRAYANAHREMEDQRQAWLAELRTRGITTAGYDDGWVDRERHCWVAPSYVHMLGPVEVGTVIALGDPRKYRCVTISRIERSALGVMRYYFSPGAF